MSHPKNPAFPVYHDHESLPAPENEGLSKLEYFYAAALTGVCMNPILCAQAIENSRSQIVGQQTDMSKALAATAYKLAQAAMQQLENESKDGF